MTFPIQNKNTVYGLILLVSSTILTKLSACKKAPLKVPILGLANCRTEREKEKKEVQIEGEWRANWRHKNQRRERGS
jgi:hypothetical protein